MRKFYTFTFGLLLLTSLLSAQDLYWVGGSGSWEDQSHWSATSNGTGGFGIPSELNNAIIDQFSILDGESISINSDAVMKSFVIDNKRDFILQSNGSNYIEINEDWIFSVSSGIALELSTSLISVSNKPNIKKAGSVDGGVFRINGDYLLWKDKEWINQSLDKSGHIPIATVFNPLCNGGLGFVVGTVSGGVGPFIFQWFSVEIGLVNGDTLQNVGAGTYQLIVTDTDDNSISVLPNVVVIEPGPINALFSNSKPSCPGASDGILNAFLIVGGTPGTTDYDVLWSTGFAENGVTSSSINGQPEGPYSITITDSNNCVVTVNDTLYDPNEILINPTVNDVSCNGFSDGQILTNATSGNGGPFTYAWTTNPGGVAIGSSSSVNGLIAGSYDLHIEDANNCAKDSTFVIIEPLVLTASITGLTHLLCNGDCAPGEAIVTPTGGTTPYNYQWFDPANNPIAGYTDSIASTLCAGNYSVRVTDANLCTILISNVIITEPALLTVVSSATDLLCNGDVNGTVVVTPSGGVIPYSFVWTSNPGGLIVGTDSLISNLPAGAYDFEVTDDNNCSIIGVEVINEPDTIGFDFTKLDLSCNGDLNGQAVISNVAGGDGNYTYLWQDAGLNIIGIGTLVTNLNAGLYTITVTDGNNCTETLGFEIIEPAAITLIATTDSASCFGFLDGAVHVVASGGTVAVDYDYDWRDLANTQVGTTADVFGLGMGTYTVTVTDDNNCTETISVSIEEPAAIVITPAITDIVCNGDMNGAISVIITGGSGPFITAWTGPNAFISLDQNISNLEGGTYNLTVLDANGCSEVGSYFVDEPAAITYLPVQVDVFCFGQATGSIQVTVSGGNGGYIYDWRDAGNVQISVTDAIVNVSAGDYTLNVTDALGCTNSETFTVDETNEILFNGIVTPITCFGATDGAIDVAPSGGTPIYSYAWVGPAGFNSVSQNISSLEAGNYTLTLTDQNLCTSDTLIVLANPPLISVAEMITHVTCAGDMNGAIDLIIVGGVGLYNTDWTGPNGFISTDQNISNLEGGDYNLTITDANNCTLLFTYTVDEPLPIVFVPTIVDVLCFADFTGSIQVIVSGGNGGYLYDWRDINGIQISTSDAIVNMGSGDYTLTVTDALNCSHNETYTIDETTEIFFNSTIAIISCTDADDGEITLAPTGGTPIYTYAWVGPLGFNSTSQNITNLEPGAYTCTIRDLNLCAKDTTINLLNPVPIVIDETLTQIACNGDFTGAIDVVITGGTPLYAFNWDGPNGFISIDQNISNLEAGDYTLLVTDIGGCTETEMYTLVQPPAIVLVPTITHILCKGDSTGQIQVIASGGNGGFLFDWRDIANTQISVTDEIINVPAGDYTLTVTDLSGCTFAETYTIQEPLQAILLTLSKLDIECNGESTGSVAVAISGGTIITPADYIIEWYDELNTLIGNTQIVSDLPVGFYHVIVTDLNNCSATDTIEIVESTLIVLNEMTFDALCNGDNSGSAQVNPTGGTVVLDYIYEWEAVLNPGAIISFTNDITNVAVGDYMITVYDDNACSISTIVSIGEPNALSVSFITIEPLCNGDMNGQIQAIAIGGTIAIDYTYEWQDIFGNVIGTNALIAGIDAGDYLLILTDDNNCELQTLVPITEPEILVFTPTIQQISCAGFDDGVISVYVTGGTSPYNVVWMDEFGTTIGNDTIISNLAAGDYTFMVGDLNNCAFTETYTITPQNTVIATYNQYVLGDCSVNPPCIAEVALTVNGGTGIYVDYQWIDQFGTDLGINNDTATAICSGSYLVTVTDSDGCAGDILVLVIDQTPEDITVETTDAICNGDLGMAIAQYLCIDAPCSIEWFEATTNTSLGLTTDTIQVVAGEYFVLITNATGCTNAALFTINEPDAINANPSSIEASCNGDCNGSASVAPTGGVAPYTYLWNDPMGQTTATAVDLCAGDYEVTITDANLCEMTLTITVGSPSPLTLTELISHVNCQDQNDGEIALTVTGGSGLYIYTWTPEVPIGNGTSTASGLAAGDYSVVIEDANLPGCELVQNYTIDQPDSLLAAITTVESTCGNSDGEASAVVTGGILNYTYLWNDPANQTTATATGLAAGIYTLSVTDANLCSEDFFIAINDQDADTLSLDIAPGICDGDFSTITANYTCLNPTCVIRWYAEDGTPLPVIGDVVTLLGGNYFVEIENGLGCSWFLPFEVINVNPIEPNLEFTSETCNGPADGTALVNPIGGSGIYTYTWLPEPATGQGSNSVTGLYAGTWEVTIEDDMACDTTITFEVLVYTPLDATLNITDASCNGDPSGSAVILPSGGIPPYTILWAPEPGDGQGSNVAEGLYAGDWTVTLSDAVGCDTTFLFTIDEPSQLEADTTVVNATCNLNPGDGSIEITVNGGSPPYTYEWFDAQGVNLGVSTSLIENLTEGIYNCVVVDDSLCTETFVAIVSEISGESIETETIDVSCFGGDDGEAWVIYGCTDGPCTVNWYDAMGIDLGLTTDTISNLSAGSYIVGVTNASGCVTYQNVVINEADEIIIDLVLNESTCSGICDGDAVATVTGGTGNYTYLWIPEPLSGQGTPNASGLCGGIWTLEITDDNNCFQSIEFEITQIDSLVANAQVGNELCEGDCNGWASVSPTGSTGDYTFFWTPEPPFGQSTDSASGLCAGDWSVLISDVNSGCNITEIISISQENPIIVSDTLIVNPECENDNNGSITLTVTGGESPYTYQWWDWDLIPIIGETDSVITDLIPGLYTITISDNIGCTHYESFTITAESDLFAYAGEDTTYCEGGGIAIFIGSGNGVNSLWMDILGNVISMGDTLSVDAPPGNTGYVFQTSDGICTARDTVYAIVLYSPQVDAGADQEIFEEESATIGGDPTAADGSIYAWSPAASLNDSTSSNPISTPFVTTEYIVYVEAESGCIGSDTVSVIIKPKFIPNDGFTPNGDGVNDVWNIGDLTDFPNIEVNIFNRWGQQLFTSKGYQEAWDGRYDGKDLPIGTYYYVIDLKHEKYPDAFTGPLTIMR